MCAITVLNEQMMWYEDSMTLTASALSPPHTQHMPAHLLTPCVWKPPLTKQVVIKELFVHC